VDIEVVEDLLDSLNYIEFVAHDILPDIVLWVEHGSLRDTGV
jgi:hypothetical protein